MKLEPIYPDLKQVAEPLGDAMASALETAAAELDDRAAVLKRAGLTARARQHTVLANNLGSLGDAITDRDATIAMFNDIMERVRGYDDDLGEIAGEHRAAIDNRGPVAEFASAAATLTDALSRVDIDAVETAVSRDIAEVLKELGNRNRALRSALPRKSVKTYALLKLPVVVTINQRLNVDVWARAGFSVRDYQGYPVIDDQIMLAVRHDYARQHDVDTYDMAVEILDTLSKTTRVRYSMVDEDARVPRGAGREFAYYWIVPDAYYGRLMPLLGSYDDWSIAM